MAKARNKEIETGGRGRIVRWLMYMIIAGVLLGGTWLGYSKIRNRIERAYLFPQEPPKVVLKNRPAWMTDLLADQIVRATRPAGSHAATDGEVLKNIASSLKTNPWIKKVNQIRRAYGEKPGDTIEVDCEYRQPMALVYYGIDYYLVDGDGILLPEKFDPKDVPQIMFTGQGAQRQINIRVIEGVKSSRPVEPGERWEGGDVMAGLGVVKLLYGQSYADEIYRVDVENFQGRKDNTTAQIVLKTMFNTKIYWGEPRDALFHIEVEPSAKLQRLSLIKQQYGRVDARHSWIDIRFDKVTIPLNETQQADGGRP